MNDAEALRMQLAEQKALFQLVLDHIPLSVFWKDRSSVYLGCNRVFAMDAGLTEPSQIVGKTDYDLAWSRDQADFFRHHDRHVMERKEAQYHIIQHQRASDGRYYWVDTNKLPLFNVGGEVIGVLGIEDKLRLSREPYEFNTETVQVGTWTWHPDMKILDLDENLLAILGMEEPKLAYQWEDWFERIESHYRGWVEKAMQEHLAGLSPSYEQRYSIVTQSGQTRWILVRGGITYDVHGKIERITGTMADITALQQAEERFRQAERTQVNLAEVLRETAELLANAMRNQSPSLATPVPTMTSLLLESASPRPLYELTLREHEVLRHLVQGRANAEIARLLHISLYTVKNHVSSLLAKLGVKTRTEAVALALREKLV